MPLRNLINSISLLSVHLHIVVVGVGVVFITKRVQSFAYPRDILYEFTARAQRLRAFPVLPPKKSNRYTIEMWQNTKMKVFLFLCLDYNNSITSLR